MRIKVMLIFFLVVPCVSADDRDVPTYLFCDGGSIPWFKDLFVALHKKDNVVNARFSFVERDVEIGAGISSEEFDFNKDGYHAKLKSQLVKLDVYEDHYSWAEDNTVLVRTGNKVIDGNVIMDEEYAVPDYKKLRINRDDLAAIYSYNNPEVSKIKMYRGGRTFRFSCEIVDETSFRDLQHKSIEKRWKKMLRAFKKSEKKQKVEKKQVI